MKECKLGQGNDFRLAEPLDTWVPVAIGSSARVFTGYLRNNNGKLKQYAIKIMRPDKPDYAEALFEEEIRILQVMDGIPGITPLIECGFISLEEDPELPPEISPGEPEPERANAFHLKGKAQRFDLQDLDQYLEEFPQRVDTLRNNDGDNKWIPYIALERRKYPGSIEHSLLNLFDLGYTKGKPRSVCDGLQMMLQICDILVEAHSRNIWYHDHKILHYIWNFNREQIFMIDWNISHLEPNELTGDQIRTDLVQFGVRGLYHVFTGRELPGALPTGPTQKEQLDEAPSEYEVKWNDEADERLHPRLKEIITTTLAGGYEDICVLRDDLQEHYDYLTAAHLKTTTIKKNWSINQDNPEGKHVQL